MKKLIIISALSIIPLRAACFECGDAISLPVLSSSEYDNPDELLVVDVEQYNNNSGINIEPPVAAQGSVNYMFGTRGVGESNGSLSPVSVYDIMRSN